MQTEHLSIEYRKESQKDYNFLLGLYEVTREDVRQFGNHLTTAQKQSFLKSQFDLQQAHYKKSFPKANYLIIRKEGNAIGRLCYDTKGTTLHVIFLAFKPQYRAQGIGKHILTEVIKTASAIKKDVTIYVGRNNEKAIKFYSELGFTQEDKSGSEFYNYMRYKTRLET